MILDLLTQKKHKVSASSGFSGINDTDFLLESSISLKQVALNSDHEYIIIEGIDKSIISDFNLETIGSFGAYSISYSLDNVNWFDFPYKISATNELYRLLSVSGSGLSTEWEYINLATNEILVETALTGSINSYTFSSYNTTSKSYENLYNELDFISLRFDIYAIDTITSPFYFNVLEINIEDFLNENILNENILELRGRELYKGRIYEDRPFLKDVTGTFFKMLGSSSVSGTKRNPIDLYNQTINLNHNLSIDNSKDNDFSFNKTIYYPERARYELDTELTEVNNDLAYITAQINQYAFEYKDLLKKINDKVSLEDNASIDIKNNFIAFLLKNMNKVNQLKGSKYLIEFVLRAYAKFIGYYVISVVEEKNFVYRISCSIPEDEWNGLLKNIVHPCGWNVIYNFIPNPGALEIELGPLNENTARYNKLKSVLNSDSYFEGDYLNKHKNIKKLFSLRPGYLTDQMKVNINYIDRNLLFSDTASSGANLGKIYLLKIINDVLQLEDITYLKYTTSPETLFIDTAVSGANVGKIYSLKITNDDVLNLEDVTNVNNLTNAVSGVNINDITTPNTSYLLAITDTVMTLTGITYNASYIEDFFVKHYTDYTKNYKLLVDESITKVLQTNDFPPNYSGILSNAVSGLYINDKISTLSYFLAVDEMILTLTEAASGSYIDHILIKDSESYSKNYELIIEEQQTKISRSNDFTIFYDSYTKNTDYQYNTKYSERELNVEYVWEQNDISYSNLPVSAGSEFALVFDTPTSITSDRTDVGPLSNFVVTYNKPGFSTKYIWKIYNNGSLSQTLISFHNVILFTIDTSANVTLELTITNHKFMYQLTNIHQLIA